MKKIPIIAIVGPTAVGKTDLSIKLAKKFNCEIISIDSVQIYKEFNIGSAKVTEAEMAGVPHYLIDYLSPEDNCSVYDFQKLAREKIMEIFNRGKIPLLIGGTGYYMNAVLYDYKFATYSEKEDQLSVTEMLDFLKENYLETFNNLDKNNERRIVNAYNYVKREEKEIVLNSDGDKLYENYNPYLIVLDRNRDNLYERINKRVEIMLEQGLIAEVKEIISNYGDNLQALSSIGYKEVLPYLKDEISLEKLQENISQNSRRYAKRQLTWFRNKMINPHWYNYDKDEVKNIEVDVQKFLIGDCNADC